MLISTIHMSTFFSLFSNIIKYAVRSVSSKVGVSEPLSRISQGSELRPMVAGLTKSDWARIRLRTRHRQTSSAASAVTVSSPSTAAWLPSSKFPALASASNARNRRNGAVVSNLDAKIRAYRCGLLRSERTLRKRLLRAMSVSKVDGGPSRVDVPQKKAMCSMS